MKRYMVTAQIKATLCNGLNSPGDLYTVNPTVGGPVMANSPEEAMATYKETKGGKYFNMQAMDYDDFVNPKANENDPF